MSGLSWWQQFACIFLGLVIYEVALPFARYIIRKAKEEKNGV